MLKESDFIWTTATTLQKFQFPWRFLSISVFMAAVLGAMFVYMVRNENVRKAILVLVIILTFVLIKDYWKAKDYLIKPESFYAGIYDSTTDTGESSPIWSVRFMEKRPNAHTEVIKGGAEIQEISRTFTRRKYEIHASERTRIKENTLFFPGWRVYVDGERYQQVQFQDPEHRGLITYYVPEGKHVVDVEFRETRFRTISNYISLASFAILVGILLKTYRISKK